MRSVLLACIFLLSFGRSVFAQADIEAMLTSGSATFTPTYSPTTPGAGAYTVTFTVTANSANAVITIRPRAAMTAAVTTLTTANVTPTTSNPLIVNIGPNGVKRFNNVKTVNLLNGIGFQASPPRCSLGTLVADSLGPVAFPPTTIQASSIGTVTANSTMTYVNIRTRDLKTGTPDNENYDIGAVVATTGNILNCAISAGYYGGIETPATSGSVGDVQATGTGALNGHIRDTWVTAKSNIGTVKSRGDMTTMLIRAGGDISLLSSTASDITGTLDCTNLGTTQTDPNAGIRATTGMVNMSSFNIDNLKSSLICRGSPVFVTPFLIINNDLTADIKVTDGCLGRVVAGRILAPLGGSIPVIEATTATTSLPHIEKLIVGGYMNATVRANTNVFSGAGKGIIGELSVGTQAGTISAAEIQKMYVENLTGTVTVEKINGGAVTDRDPWKIGDSLSGTLNVTRSPAGLLGFVLVNSDVIGGSWLAAGSVNISPVVVLSPEPAYTTLAASLGGGGVGEVPLRLHAEDSKPVNVGSTLGRFVFSTSPTDPALIMPEVEDWPIWQYAGAQDIIDAFYSPGRRKVLSRFYGPVTLAGVSGPETNEQGVRIQLWNATTSC